MYSIFNMPRLNREEKKELTTSQLLETANTIFLQRGYHRSTLDDIADAAGVTKGAVYARFASKDDLFFALYARREEKIVPRLDQMPNLKTFEEFALDQARRLIALRREDANWYLLLLEFWTYAARDDRLRREFAARHNQSVKRIAARLEKIAAHVGVKLRLPALALARAASAMAQGFTLERLADPIGVPETLLESMFLMLAHEGSGGLEGKRATPQKAPAKTRSSPVERRNHHGNRNVSTKGKPS
jgi:AcrR family transcriptional regulator